MARLINNVVTVVPFFGTLKGLAKNHEALLVQLFTTSAAREAKSSYHLFYPDLNH
jgi:hypothetical protein